jgi:hypothetical protein
MNNIDVYVEGAYHNIEFEWIVECKAWKSNVPKEEAMTLMSILQDVGADRGFFLFPYQTPPIFWDWHHSVDLRSKEIFAKDFSA